VKQNDVVEGQDLKHWTYRVVREDLVKYANASGDQNPIHQNEDFAKSVGLPDVISHGMYTMAKMGQYVTDWCGNPGAVLRFRTRFTNIVPVPKSGGNEVTVSGRVRTRSADRAVVDVVASLADGTKVAQGEAEVRLS
jgi:acyl dehydratase